MAERLSIAAPEVIFAGGGKLGELMRRYNWAETSIGPVESWSQTLRTVVSTLLNTQQPMFVLWGSELMAFYNDGYRAALGLAERPVALGKSGPELWPEIWEAIGPMVKQVMAQGKPAVADNVWLLIRPEEQSEEVYYTFSCSPIRNEQGEVQGLLCTCSDMTRSVVRDRRLRTLRSLERNTQQALTAQQACQIAAETLFVNSQDIPFALLYLIEENDSTGESSQIARLKGSTGIEPGTTASPITIPLSGSEPSSLESFGLEPVQYSGWNLSQVLARQQAQIIGNLAAQFEPLGGLPKRLWNNATVAAKVMPLGLLADSQVTGVLIMGISAQQRFDDEYEDFLDLVAGSINRSIAYADSVNAKRRNARALAKTDQALRVSQQQLEFALNTGKIGSWQLLLATNTLVTSDRCKLNYGLPVDADFTHQVLMDRIHPDDKAWVEAAIQNTIDTGTDYDVEYRTVWNDGSIHWVVARAYLAYDRHNCPDRLIGISIDITARRRTEAAVRESEQRFRRVVESNIFGVMFANAAGGLHYVNDYIADLLGYSVEELTSGQTGWDKLTPLEYAVLDGDAIAQMKAKGVCSPYEKDFQHKDGRRIPVLVAGAMLQEPFDRTDEGIGFVFDLTELKRVTEERDGFFNLSPDMVALGNIVGGALAETFSYVNQSWEKAIGFSVEAITTQPFLSFVHPEDIDRTISVAQRMAQGSDLVNFENRYRCKDGSYIWLSWNVTVLPDRSQFCAIARDVTKSKAAAAEREQLLAREQAARKAAERANQIKDEFLAVVSHELRSPLNPILGWTQLLRRGNLTPEKTQTALETIERNAKLQVQLIGDLLDISSVLRGKLNLQAAPVNLSAVAANALETVQQAAIAKSLQIDTHFSDCTVIGDAVRLQQVIGNLLTNAVKFTQKGGRITLRLSAEADENAESAEAVIRITDTGKGIGDDFLPYVFEHFRQEDYSTTRQFGGLGLGLAIVQQIVEMHSGTVAAASPGEGQGATFTVRLPLVPTPGDRISPEVSATHSHDLSGVCVLLVEDDLDSQEITAYALTLAEATVITAASGAAALEAISDRVPDVLVSDVGMPDMDGYALMSHIRARSPAQGRDVWAIALTAYAGETDRQRAIDAGFQQYLTKPVDPDTLIQTIKRLMNRDS